MQSAEDIERREAAAGVAEVANLGSHGPLALLEEKWVHSHSAHDGDLERAYWFLRSEVWFLDEVTAVKRTVGLYGQLSDRWTPGIDDDDARALRWLFAEAVSVFTLNAVAVAADALVDNDKLFSASVGERLSGGVVSADAMRRISADVDRYIGGLLAARECASRDTDPSDRGPAPRASRVDGVLLGPHEAHRIEPWSRAQPSRGRSTFWSSNN